MESWKAAGSTEARSADRAERASMTDVLVILDVWTVASDVTASGRILFKAVKANSDMLLR